MYRIVYDLDNPAGRCAYLREVVGDYQPTDISPYVVVAREYDDENGPCATRTWFLSLHQLSDGESPALEVPPRHKIVSSRLEPGVETPPADPMVRITGGLQPVLHNLKQKQIKDFIKVRQHQEFCQTYKSALNQAEQSQQQVSRLRSQLADRDSTISDQATTINGLQSSLDAATSSLRMLRKQKTLAYRVRLRVRTWFQK
jgi:hypothetical protein